MVQFGEPQQMRLPLRPMPCRDVAGEMLLHRLENPRNNKIDVIKIEKRRRYILVGPYEEVHVRVTQIGFPRWTAQVSPDAIKAVRQATKLTHKDGVDSGAFFHGLDPMQTLITSYHEPLMRLAHR